MLPEDPDVEADSILTAGTIVVTDGARVRGQLVACMVEIAGKVWGEVLASQVCRVRGTGRVAGRILCRHIVVEEGGQVEGELELIRSPVVPPRESQSRDRTGSNLRFAIADGSRPDGRGAD